MAQTFTLDDFLEYKTILINGSEEEQRDIINRIRRTSSIEQSPPLDLIVKADLVPLLLKYHENHDISEASLQDILWTLANLGSGSGSETLYMVDNGGIEYFITFMHHASEKVYAQALWGLANVAGESAKFRDLLLGKGLLTQVIELYYKKKTVMKPDTRRTIAWLINNLCRNKPAVQFQKIEECLPYLATSLKDSDSDVVVENLWSCCYITEISEQAVKAVTNWPIIERVVSKLIENITNLTIVAPALKTCSNVVSGNDEVTEKVLSLDILPTINELLYNSKSIIRREACYFLSNVAAGLPHQIDAIFDLQGIMDRLIVILKDDDIGVVNEAVWLVSNSVMGNNFDHARKIVNKNIYMPIFKRIGELGKRAQLMAMEGFRELLNHVMSMPDTPADILAQIKYYKENVEGVFQKQIDPMFTRTLSDIDNLISDVAENAKNVEVAFATFRAARTFI